MGLFIDELCSSVIVTHMLYKTALVIAVIRWAWSWATRLRNRTPSTTNNTYYDHNTTTTTTTTTSLFQSQDIPFPSPPIPSSSTNTSSAQLIRDGLVLTTFGEFSDRLQNCPWDTCAVCLNQFSTSDEVRELRNCSHVFHRECLDKWLDHDRQKSHDSHHQSKSCPLCRSPLLTESQAQSLCMDYSARSQPSWAVERLLYLFGDDLLL